MIRCTQVIQIAQEQNLEIRREGDKWFGPDGEELDVEEEIELEYDSDDAQSQFTATSGIDDYEQYIKEEQNITEEEEAAFNMFLSDQGGKKMKTIADLIEEQMQKRDRGVVGAGGDVAMGDAGDEAEYEELDAKIVEVYKGVGKLLTRYKSGKLPKALKMVPSLNNWQQILAITDPEGWSNHAYYAATRIFASCLSADLAQRFYNLVLLPRVVQVWMYACMHVYMHACVYQRIYNLVLLPCCVHVLACLHTHTYARAPHARTHARTHTHTGPEAEQAAQLSPVPGTLQDPLQAH